MKRSPDRLLGFFLGVAVIYLLLVVPWNGWKETYADYFRSLANGIFGVSTEERTLRFDLNHGILQPLSLDTDITVNNRDMIGPDGHPYAMHIGIDSREVGWLPMALFLALVLATPVSWPRRIAALFWGFIVLHGMMLFYIWLYVAHYSLSTSSLIVQGLVEYGYETFFVTAEPRSFVAILTWMLFVFRRSDYQLLVTYLRGQRSKPQPSGGLSSASVHNQVEAAIKGRRKVPEKLPEKSRL